MLTHRTHTAWRTRWTHRVAALVLLLAVAPASAQDDDAGRNDDDTVHALDDIVVTGTKTESRAADAPVPTQVIRRDEIEATATDSVAEVLDQIPGLYVRRNEEFRLGANTVRMQGADPNKVAILLDGRRFRGGVDGVVDLRDIPVSAIERIEIIRGPASSLYGSDAMGGVINIITRTGTSTPTASVTTAGGSFDRVLVKADHSYRIGRFGYFLSAQHDEGEIAQQYGEVSRQFAGVRSDAKQVRDDVFAKLAYEPIDDQHLSLTADYHPVREGPLSDRTDFTIGGGWHGTLTSLTDGDVNLSRYAFSRKNELQGFEEDVDYEDWTGEVLAAHAFAHGFWSEQHLFSLGYRVRAEELQSKGLERDTPNGTPFTVPGVDEGALLNSPYLQNEIVFSPRWRGVLGTSFDIHDRFGFAANPRVGLTWQPLDWARIAATVGRGFRAPDLLQLYDVDANNIVAANGRVTGYVILGNPNLDPETDIGMNLELEVQAAPGANITIDLYRHEFRDLIDIGVACFGPTTCVPGFENPFPDLSGQVFRYENVGKARTQGVELAIKLEPLVLAGVNAGPHRLGIDLSYGYLHARNLSPMAGQTNDELPFRPPHRFIPSLRYRHTHWGSELKVWAEYEDRTFTDLANTTDFVAQSHWLLNFRVSQRLGKLLPNSVEWPALRWATDRLTLFVEGTNVLDEEFGLSTPMGRLAGRASFLGGVTAAYGGKP